MGYIVLQGSLSFENYSQTQIKLTFDNGYSVVDYFFDKRLVRIPIPDDPLTAEQLLIIPGVGPEYPNVFQFAYPDVILPVTTSSDEFRNIINSWLYTGGPEISVNGGTPVGPLNTINLIEGTNITITAVDNLTSNAVDVTIDASSGGGGTVTAVTGTSPIASSGGTTPDISIQQASTSQAGYLSSTDWNTFNGKGNGTVTAVTATSLLTSSGGTTPDISSQVAKAKLVGRNSVTAGVMEEITVGSGLSLSGTTLSASGITGDALTKTDDTNVTLTLGGTPSTALLVATSLTLGWTGTLADSRIASASTWNAKQAALGYTPVSNALMINTTAPLTGGGALTSDKTLAITQATTSTNGYLSSTDWTTFNGKQTSPWDYRQTGRWWTPSVNQLAIGSLTNAINSIRYSPFIVERDITVTQLGIAVVTSGGASTTCRLGIYSNDPTTTKPLTRLVDSGTLALDSTGVRSATGLSVVLAKGLYWFAYFSNASTGTITSIANLNLPDVIGTTTLNNGPVNIYSQSLTYTSLPATAGTLVELIQASSYCIYHYY